MLGRSPGPLRSLEKRLGHRFSHPALLEEALTHRSFAFEEGDGSNYERLEFLGDSVLGLVAAEWLFQRFPEYPEGELAKLKSRLVSEPILAPFSREIGLGERMHLGVGEERSGGRNKASLLADVLEAVIGALFVDGGLKAARRVVIEFLEDALEKEGHSRPFDAKSVLQELAQARAWDLPEYRHVEESGPDHRKTFTVECWLRGRSVGRGRGRSKKLAEQEAAWDALEALDAEGDSIGS